MPCFFPTFFLFFSISTPSQLLLQISQHLIESDVSATKNCDMGVVKATMDAAYGMRLVLDVV
ncbi:hypothetical protein BTJ40_04440 [Microbulbifer sp. A4B17]|nr:hypothetical protein BTJ40_04440 [Microbulbifer sp. A4B17]